MATPPAPGEPWTAADLMRIEQIAAEEFAAAQAHGLTGAPLLWEQTAMRFWPTSRRSSSRIRVGVPMTSSCPLRRSCPSVF